MEETRLSTLTPQISLAIRSACRACSYLIVMDQNLKCGEMFSCDWVNYTLAHMLPHQ